MNRHGSLLDLVHVHPGFENVSVSHVSRRSLHTLELCGHP